MRALLHAASAASAFAALLAATSASLAADCKPGTMNASGTCTCPAGFSSHGLPGKATCMKSNVGIPTTIKPPSGGTATKTSSGPTCGAGTSSVGGGAYTTSKSTEVKISPFCMDKTEVTVASYAACVDAGSCTTPTPYQSGGSWSFQAACNWKHPDGRARHPINCVTFGQARDYCTYKKGRLPTEWEWEWAARSKSKATKFPWGADDVDKKRGNFCGAECVAHVSKAYSATWKGFDFDDGFAETAPVGSFASGASGDLLDLAGNVAEYTLSYYGIYGTEAVVRGGSWSSYLADYVTASSRDAHATTDGSPTIGFRCIQSEESISLPTPAKAPPAVGQRIARGPDWKWGDQGKGFGGTVIAEANEDGWVQVRWDNAEENDYRWGADGYYDLKLATGTLPQACDKSGASGSAVVGAKVILQKHREVGKDDNWASDMNNYVGKTATITSVPGFDDAGCTVVRVDVDKGAYVWRVRDLGLP